MDQIPEIKPDVNTEEEEKQGGGFLAKLMGSGAAGEGSASGFGWGALGRAAAGGGLLATKAGLVGLIVAGTTVAGGLGLLGYKVFGPGASDRMGQKADLFASRPAGAQNADSDSGDSSANKSGDSDSLNSFAKANAGSQEAGGSASPAEGSQAGAGASGSASVGSGQGNKANVMGNKAASLSPLKKIEGAAAGGSGGGSHSAASSGGSSGVAAKTSLSGSKMALAGAGKASSGISGRRGIGAGSNGRGAAWQQLASARGNQYGAGSSQQAGGTYDGSNISRPGIGGGGSGKGVGVTGGGNGFGDQPTFSPNGGTKQVNSSGADCLMNPSDPSCSDVTPWKKELNQAKMFLAIAIGLIWMGTKMKGPYAKYIQMILGAVAAGLAVKVMMLGSKIAGGEYGQVLQGSLLMLSAAGIGIAAAAMIAGAEKSKDGSMSGTTKMILTVGGAVALGGLAVVYYSPPRQFPPGFDGVNCWETHSCDNDTTAGLFQHNPWSSVPNQGKPPSATGGFPFSGSGSSSGGGP